MDRQPGRLLQESESAGVLPAVAEAVTSQQRLLHRFYWSVLESTVLFNQVCWYNTAKNGDSDRLSHTAAAASITTGQQVRTRSPPPVSPAGQESASRESSRSGVRLPRVQQVRSPPPVSPAGQESASRESCRSGTRRLATVSREIHESGVCFP